jgi:hypothetical protein
VPEGAQAADIEAAAAQLLGSQGQSGTELPQFPDNPANPFTAGRKMTQTDLKVAQYVTPEAVFATLASMAVPGIGASGAPLLTRLAAFAGPKVIAAGLGGGTGAALKEAGYPDSTTQTVTQQGLNGALRQMGAEVAGLGASAALNKLMTPNLSSIRALSERAQEATALVPNKVSEYIAGMPEGTSKELAQNAQRIAGHVVEGVDHLLDMGDKIGMVGELARGHVFSALLGSHPAGWSLAALRELVRPGPILRYLTSEPMSEATREILRQAITAPIRSAAVPADDSSRAPRLPQDEPFTAAQTP